jgi:protein-tyrosine phosphatase
MIYQAAWRWWNRAVFDCGRRPDRPSDLVMYQIAPYNLWLGHAGDGVRFEAIFQHDIRAVFYLAVEETPVRLPRDLISCRFPLVDGAGNSPHVLGLAIRTLAGHFQLQLPTLVTCGAGLSRSPAIAAAALAVVSGREPAECLRQIAAQHPTDVSPGLWQDVQGLAFTDWTQSNH